MATIFNAPVQPLPLGLIKVTPGTPQQVGSSFTDVSTTTVKTVTIEADPQNTGYIYVLVQLTATAANTGTTGTANIVYKLNPGNYCQIGPPSTQGPVAVGNIYIDGTVANDVAIPSSYQQ